MLRVAISGGICRARRRTSAVCTTRHAYIVPSALKLNMMFPCQRCPAEDAVWLKHPASNRLCNRTFARHTGASLSAAAASRDGGNPAREEELDSSLCEVLSQARDKLYYAAGDLSLGQPVKLFYQTPKGAVGVVTFPVPDEPTDSTAEAPSSLQPLLAAAVPSPFGRGRETKYDPDYRTASELSAADVGLNTLLPPAELLNEVRTLLQPNAAAVLAEFYKVNIYGPGGFFKPHFDTPRSPDMFGSLVICLPSRFTGGELVLRHSQKCGITHQFDWAGQSDKLQWAAFYSDSEHEVLPVSSGYRITLTYHLRTVPQEVNSSTSKPADDGTDREATATADAHADGGWMTSADIKSSRELLHKVTELMRDPAWHTEDATVGFILQHKYSRDLNTLAGLDFPAALKGPDRVLAATMQQAGLKHRFVPVFLGWSGNPWGCDELEWEEEFDEILNGIRVNPPDAKPAPTKLQPAQQQPPPSDTEVMDQGRWEEMLKEYLDLKRANDEPVPNAKEIEQLRKKCPQDYWQLLVGDFSQQRKEDSGYPVRDLTGEYLDSTDNSNTIWEYCGATARDDIVWCTPVQKEDFTYMDTVLAGANSAYVDCFYATAAMLVEVPPWKDRQP